MLKKQLEYIKDFIYLFFPLHCEACRSLLVKNEVALCTKCLYELPRTDFCYDNDNDIVNLFAGRIRLNRATALFTFHKESRFRKLIHKLKYQNKPDIGIILGRELGADMLASKNFSDIDYIIPVPLHSKRRLERGYNQSELIGRGISQVINKPMLCDVFIRSAYTKTQTKMTRDERWSNVSGKFLINNEELIRNKHVLLIDDVVTTGSTIEACGEKLLSVKGLSLSVAVLAIA